MKIIVYVPGDYNDGWNSNTRGEGRWSLNFAVMMAAHGHDVLCFGLPGKGQVPGCRVTTTNDPAIWGESFDIYFDTTYLPSRADEIDARVFCHAYWSFDSISAKIRDYGPNHYGAIATYQRHSEIPL